MPDNGAHRQSRTMTVVLGLVFAILTAIDVILMSRFGPDYASRGIGHGVGALLLAFVGYGIVYGIFLRKKKSFSILPIIIIAIVLIAVSLLQTAIITS